MKRNTSVFVVILIMFAVSFFTSCGQGSTSNQEGERETINTFVFPEAPENNTSGNYAARIDFSNSSEGYVMIKYEGSSSKAKVQISGPEDTDYLYTLNGNDYEAFPLSGGSGAYHIEVLERVNGDLYALVFSDDINVELKDEFRPFLYPNQYSWYTKNSKTISLGKELSDKSSDDIGYVENVYAYVTRHIDYDTQLAEYIPVDYIPDVDNTLSSGKGVCFDYASLMTALLRSQGIPTKLEVGYSGTAYHAWISVYLKEKGWVDNIIEFDGQNWSIMDPTLAAESSSSSVKKYVGDGSNYMVKYHY